MSRMDVDRVPRIDVARIDATILDVASMLALAMAEDPIEPDHADGRGRLGGSGSWPADDPGAAHVGVWASADGAVCLELGADGRYGLRIVGRHSRTVGVYRADRLTVLLEADEGLRTAAQFTDDVLHLAGHRLHRRR